MEDLNRTSSNGHTIPSFMPLSLNHLFPVDICIPSSSSSSSRKEKRKAANTVDSVPCGLPCLGRSPYLAKTSRETLLPQSIYCVSTTDCEIEQGRLSLQYAVQ